MAERLIGDLLITFGNDAENCQARSTQPWTMVANLGAGRVYTTQPDEQWRGFPLTESEDEEWRIWLLGELFDQSQPLTQAIFQPEKLNGHFLLVGYEKLRKRVHVITSRLGTVHCYYADNGGIAAVGTFSPAAAQATGCSRLNLQAIVEFFTFGFFLGDKTHWQDVTILPAATDTVLDESGKIISQVPYWHWHYEPSASLTYDEAIDGFQDIFRSVLTKQIAQKRIALPLSGGLDSRSTLAELGEPGMGGAAQIFPFSYGYSKDSVETKIARQLGSKRGMPVRTWTIQPYLFDRIERVCAEVEGFQDLTICRQAYVVDELSKQADHIVAAHWGDVWLDDMGFLGQAMISDERLAAVITKKYAKNGSQVLQSLFLPNLPTDWQEKIMANVHTSLSGFDKINDLDFKIKAWKTSRWSFRWTLSSLRVFQAGMFPILPFYDNDLVDFFTQVPGEFLAGRKLQVDYLKRFAPDLARVKWQQFDANLYQYKGFTTWRLPRRAIQKLKRQFFPGPIVQRNWELQFLNPEGKAGLNQYLLEPGLKLHGLFSVQVLQQLLADFYRDPSAARGYAVSMLLTLSAWLEQYG